MDRAGDRAACGRRQAEEKGHDRQSRGGDRRGPALGAGLIAWDDHEVIDDEIIGMARIVEKGIGGAEFAPGAGDCILDGSPAMAEPPPGGQAGQRSGEHHHQHHVPHNVDAGVPVIYESLPSYNNLIGRIEHTAQQGALLTDFTMIRAGALHRANGGYLVVEVSGLLANPLAWDALKRAIKKHDLNMVMPRERQIIRVEYQNVDSSMLTLNR